MSAQPFTDALASEVAQLLVEEPRRLSHGAALHEAQAAAFLEVVELIDQPLLAADLAKALSMVGGVQRCSLLSEVRQAGVLALDLAHIFNLALGREFARQTPPHDAGDEAWATFKTETTARQRPQPLRARRWFEAQVEAWTDSPNPRHAAMARTAARELAILDLPMLGLEVA